MDIQKVKEDLSISYMSIVSAMGKIALENIRHDEDSVDAVIKKIINLDGGLKFNSQISVQLKATSSNSQYSETEELITYQLKVKNYNDLCMPSSMPSILALLILPDNEEDWVNWSPKELMLNGCMYWMNFQNCEKSNNDSHISVKIPKTNLINCSSLLQLLEKAAKEGEI